MKRISRSAIVECEAGDFYELVGKIEAYPEFLPWCAAAAVLDRAPGWSVATLTLAVKGVRQSITTENTFVAGRSIEMRLVKGPFRKFDAAWHFTPLGAGACKAEYAMEYEFSNRAVALVLEPVFRQIADSTVDAFTKRVQRAR